MIMQKEKEETFIRDEQWEEDGRDLKRKGQRDQRIKLKSKKL